MGRCTNLGNMASFSDDEGFEKQVESILEQRKRKGAIEYLVRWRGAGESQESETWEPAKTLIINWAQVVQDFLTKKKEEKKRSTSRSRKGSRSRSRSSSRNRKTTKAEEKTKSRSRSRGRPKKSSYPPNEPETSNEGSENKKNTRSKSNIVISESSTSVTKETVTLQESTNSIEAKDNTDSSEKMTAKSSNNSNSQLEVQRVVNEQCPASEDNKPRSAIWKVADYAVIVLFILSLIAAIFLFLEKILDLEDFKKQALPNMRVLQERLEAGKNSFMDLIFYCLDSITHCWFNVMEQIKGAENTKKSA
ncbi:chromobox protein homolog 5-like [Physella acuta]|uniref:chromobox protein homolog 5-like n=1 Tax=Physella acuta TaxID=109671 RepID=UPI0027DB1CAC|nr:chromobox protein homolog 5-like [Physella acuta]